MKRIEEERERDTGGELASVIGNKARKLYLEHEASR